MITVYKFRGTKKWFVGNYEGKMTTPDGKLSKDLDRALALARQTCPTGKLVAEEVK